MLPPKLRKKLSRAEKEERIANAFVKVLKDLFSPEKPVKSRRILLTDGLTEVRVIFIASALVLGPHFQCPV